MTIWDFQIRLTRRLLTWSAFSMVFAALTFFSANPLLRGLAIQFFVWGAVDGVIAVYGARLSARKQARVQAAELGEKEAQESRWLARVLWVNTGLDVLYVLGGVWLMQSWGAESPLWRGHGLGVVIQGGFLFFFDAFHAFVLRNLRIT
jgi:hypothetical protein